MSHYTEADVQAVAEAMHLDDYGRWTSGPDPDGTPWGTSREQTHRFDYERRARAVLDAAAPAIAARALREAAVDGPLHFAATHTGRDARGWNVAEADWLRERADKIEGAN